ncbi:MAG: leucine-rich repeat domain-containing protein [Cyclobacteriaceae bacterium]|nr:leucine-rich repeat domain-containing protein [Cyclobacteriaceae bacterium]
MMKRLTLLVLILLLSLKIWSQQVVEFTRIDQNGVAKTIRTDRPDTLSSLMQSKLFARSAQSNDQLVFANKTDSVLYEKVNKEMLQLMRVGNENKVLDSLMDMYRQIRERSIGTRKVYRPHPEFFPADSLSFEKDKSLIISLSISNTRITSLPKSLFECTELEELELVNTSVRKLPRKLRKLKKLRAVYIYNNRTSQPLVLRKNTSVDRLVIRGEDPSKLPARYKAFRNLRYLDLSYNNLTGFPKGTARNKKLVELILSNNKINLEKDIIVLHPTLEKLDLGKNKISHVPSSIQQFPNLKLLKFNHNQITVVDPAIGKLTKLEQLSFYSNQLKSIPTGALALQNLKEIDLYYNEIEKVEPAIAQWKRLEILYLAFNKIYSLPQQWDSLTQLRELYLHNNRISSIPSSIGSLPQLHTLRINNNLLTEIPGSLQQLQLLEYLDVSNNSIHLFPLNPLQFPKLKILSLVANAWETETKTSLIAQTKSLREKGVVVHLNSFDESIE